MTGIILARRTRHDAACNLQALRPIIDLHDLVGHSLSVIALKAELAGRLLHGRADTAQTHVAEIERVVTAKSPEAAYGDSAMITLEAADLEKISMHLTGEAASKAAD